MYAVFSDNCTFFFCFVFFFYRELWRFSIEHFDRLHSIKFSLTTRNFYIWEVLYQEKHPCEQVFQKTFIFNSDFNFTFDLAFSRKIFLPAVSYLRWENVCGKAKHKLRFTSDEFKSMSFEFKSTSYEFQFTSYEFESESYEFQFTSYKLQFTSYEFKSMS